MKKALVRGSEEVVALLQGSVVGGALSGKGGVLVVVLDIDKVDLHLLLGADADDKGRTLAGGDDLMGVVDGLDQETKGALQLLDDGLDERGEAEVRVLSVDVLGELRDGLSVGLGLELVALALEQSLQLLVVCDDSVVDDRELPVGVRPAGAKSQLMGSWLRNGAGGTAGSANPQQLNSYSSQAPCAV